ncbi:MFS transporter [Agromyces larvae]|uniref:MFS transporter n=1 Tax=Agromyces larvae TaxID=2929802 RepID=A0ABY4BXP2_9MICO|nr:MFS transporter [Agromyces larvae]UOE43965.1 MFS transporter [Agromyces larvae]
MSRSPRTPEDPATASLFARITASLSDPVLRILVTATMISRIGRGVFLTVTVLYFTLIVHLPAHEVAIVLAVSSGIGVLASLAGGWLADRLPPRRLILAFTTLEGLGLAGYAFVGDFASALAVAAFVGGFGQAANSTRMAIIARAFVGEARVHARAVLRTVTNLAIAVGSGFGAIALTLGTAEAYRGLLLFAAAAFLLGLLALVRLPATVDEPVTVASDPVLTATGSTDTVATKRAARRARAAHSPWRDPRYLALTALCAVFAMQFGVGELAVPLWIAHATEAPEVLMSAVLILNTIVVILFQVPLANGTHDLRRAGRVSAIAAWLMAAACLVYAAATGQPAWVAVVVIVTAALAHAFAEVLSQAGGWGLSFELADPVRAGTYQGVFGMGFSIGAMLAPLLVAATVDRHGVLGWGVLAAVFLVSGLGVWVIARAAAGAQERAGEASAASAGAGAAVAVAE